MCRRFLQLFLCLVLVPNWKYAIITAETTLIVDAKYNGKINPKSIDIFSTTLNDNDSDTTTEYSIKKVSKDILSDNLKTKEWSVQDKSNGHHHHTTKRSTNLFSDLAMAGSNPASISVPSTDESTKGVVENGLKKDEIRGDKTAKELLDNMNKKVVTEITIQETVDGQTIKRKPTEEELRLVESNSDKYNEIFAQGEKPLSSEEPSKENSSSPFNVDEDFVTFMKNDAGFVEDADDTDPFNEWGDDNDEINDMESILEEFESPNEERTRFDNNDDEMDSNADKDKDYRKFYHTERQNFSNVTEVKIMISQTEGDFFDDEPSQAKENINATLNNITKLLNETEVSVITTTENYFTTISANLGEETTIIMTENITISPLDNKTRDSIDMPKNITIVEITRKLNIPNDNLTDNGVSIRNFSEVTSIVKKLSEIKNANETPQQNNVKNGSTSNEHGSSVSIRFSTELTRNVSSLNSTFEDAEDVETTTYDKIVTIPVDTSTVDIIDEDITLTKVNEETTISTKLYSIISSDLPTTTSKAEEEVTQYIPVDIIDEDITSTKVNEETTITTKLYSIVSSNLPTTTSKVEEEVTQYIPVDIIDEDITSTKVNEETTISTKLYSIVSSNLPTTTSKVEKEVTQYIPVVSSPVDIIDKDITSTKVNEETTISSKLYSIVSSNLPTTTSKVEEEVTQYIPVDTSPVDITSTKFNEETTISTKLYSIVSSNLPTTTSKAEEEVTQYIPVDNSPVYITSTKVNEETTISTKLYSIVSSNLPTTTSKVEEEVTQASTLNVDFMTTIITDREFTDINTSTHSSIESVKILESSNATTIKEGNHEITPDEVESILNAKIKEYESIEDDKEQPVVDYDFLTILGENGQKVQIFPILKVTILNNSAQFSIKISKKDDTYFVPTTAYITEYENIINITWRANANQNNSVALRISEADDFYMIKEIIVNLFTGNKFVSQQKPVAFNPDPILDDTMPGRTRVVMMRDGTYITFSNVEFLKKSTNRQRENSEASTRNQRLWHFEIASICVATVVIVAIVLYVIAIKTKAKITLSEKDELPQVTHC